MKRVLFTGLAIVLVQSGCFWAPGMDLNEGAAKARGRATGDETYDIVTIDTDVVLKQAQEWEKLRHEAPPDPLADQASHYEYHVGAFDILSVTVWEHPELTIPAGEFRSPEATGHPVTSDGRMFYPYVGVVEVAGKTLPAIRQLLTDRLAKVLEKPQLDVKVVAFRSQKVQVTGEVMAPSTWPITDVPLRAVEAINQAHGLSPEADPSRVVLARNGMAYILNLQALNERGDLSQNWYLTDGDVLHVPDRNVNKVFVLGEVKKPSARVMVKGRMSLADAIADTEGVDPLTSNPSRIYVIRGAFSKPLIYRLDASSPDALLLAVQFQLQPHDVIYVSTYELTKWNRIMSQIAPTVQALWQTFDVTNRSGILRPFFPTTP